VRDWFGSEETVPELIQKRKYGKAEKLLRRQFQAGSRDPELRLQLADVLALDGRGKDAVPIYIGLADEFGRAGNAAKAIGVLKKIERIAPGRADVANRLASLIGDHGAAAAAVPAPPAAEMELEIGAAGPPEPEPAAEAADAPVAAEAILLEDAIVPDEAIVLDEAAHPEPAAPAASVPLAPGLASPLFGDFSREDLLAVMSALRFLTFDPGDIIVGDGEPGDSLFVISSGRVKAFVKGPAGRYKVAREMGEGDFFGEIALLHGRPRTATVTAADRCELLELERATVETIAATHPRVREVLLSFCNARVAGA